MEFLIIFPDWGYFPLPYRRTIPPLSPAALAGILKNFGTITFVDERLEEVPFDREFDIVFISAMTNQAGRAYELAAEFRKKGITVALGGVHPSLNPDEAADYADVVFVGEVEDTLPSFIRDYKKGSALPRYTCESLEWPDMKASLPDRSIYPGKGYLPIDPVLFFRGCRLACEACSIPQTQGRKVFFRDIDAIVEELAAANDYLFLVNDDLYFHQAFLMEIFRELKGMKKYWLGLGAAEMATDKNFLKAMKESGCWLLYLDFGPREGMALNHPDRARGLYRQMEERIAVLKASGIKVIGSFTFGYDFDTPAIFDNTLEFCSRNNIDEAEFHILVPYPHTRLWDRCERQNRIITRDWKRYTATEPVFKPKNMTPDELLSGYRKAWQSFYNVPTSEQMEEFAIESLKAFPEGKPEKTVY